MRLCKLRIEFHRLECCFLRFCDGFPRRDRLQSWTERHISLRDSRIRQRAIRVSIESFTIKPERLVHIGSIAFVPEITPLQIQLVSNGVDRARTFECLLLARSHVERYLLRDRSRNFTLDGENVAHVAVVSARPQAAIVGSDQLRSDVNTVSRALHRTFYDRVHLQLMGDLGQWLVGTFVLHR